MGSNIAMCFIGIRNEPEGDDLFLSLGVATSSSSVTPTIIFLVYSSFASVLFSFLVLGLSWLCRGFGAVTGHSRRLCSIVCSAAGGYGDRLRCYTGLLCSEGGMVGVIAQGEVRTGCTSLGRSIKFFYEEIKRTSKSYG